MCDHKIYDLHFPGSNSKLNVLYFFNVNLYKTKVERLKTGQVHLGFVISS